MASGGKTFRGFDALVAGINRDLQNVLKRDVAPVVKNILEEHISDDIYSVYVPAPGAWVGGSTYQRRHILETSIVSWVERQNNVLATTSTAPASPPVARKSVFDSSTPGAFLALLESGHMGFLTYTKAGASFPRPALSNAQEDINGNPQILEAIRRGLGG